MWKPDSSSENQIRARPRSAPPSMEDPPSQQQLNLCSEKDKENEGRDTRFVLNESKDPTLLYPAISVNRNIPRKRASRWGDVSTESPGMSTVNTKSGVYQTELDKHGLQIKLDRKLNLNNLLSLPLLSDMQPGGTDLCEFHCKQRSEDESFESVERAFKTDANTRPSTAFQQKRPPRLSHKVYIPVKEYPQINFFGLLVGPRGNSLKKMERESGAKISIRGKGSVKEGKSRPDLSSDNNEEDLHCLVTADYEENVAACVKMINHVIETAASTPEGQNDHKRHQLRELAALNGTLRDDENQSCQNCGVLGHRKYDCPEHRKFPTSVICRSCGAPGHMARDCSVSRDSTFSTTAGSCLSPKTRHGEFTSDHANLANEPRECKGNATTGARSTSEDGEGLRHGLPLDETDVCPWNLQEKWQTTTTNSLQLQLGGDTRHYSFRTDLAGSKFSGDER